MRINKFLALATGVSRRAADRAIEEGRASRDGTTLSTGYDVQAGDSIVFDGQTLQADQILQQTKLTTILFNKPVGCVVSRDGQGSQTIYDLLPAEYHSLKPVGRLDKFSSGLLLLTNDGQLAYELTHPSSRKVKVYEIKLSKALAPLHRQMIQDHGVQLEDGRSSFQLERLQDGDGGGDQQWRITMHEGRNRQIRRTFLALGYGVSSLHRVQFGDYHLDDERLPPGACAAA